MASLSRLPVPWERKILMVSWHLAGGRTRVDIEDLTGLASKPGVSHALRGVQEGLTGLASKSGASGAARWRRWRAYGAIMELALRRSRVVKVACPSIFPYKMLDDFIPKRCLGYVLRIRAKGVLIF
jgi:hypothetical protein